MDNAACVQTVPGDTNIMSRKARYFAHRTFLRLNVLIYFFPRFNVIDALCFCSRVFFTLTVTCCVRVLSSHHAVLLINLCLALIVANVLFLSGVDKTLLHVSSLRRRRTRLIITLVSSSRSTAEWISHHYVRCLLEEFIHTKCVARHPLWTNFNSQLAAYCNAFLPRDAMLAH